MSAAETNPGMTGAESLVHTLIDGGVEVCFANPGTSEMHFVAALDRIPGMRCVLALFEGVVTGAADGYGRMADKPAATLLHLGPGLANGCANLHNAKRASSPILNIVGEHATHHQQYDSPLNSDIESVARAYSRWVRTSPSSRMIAADAAEAIVAARRSPGQIATLILPADTAWGPSDGPAPAPVQPATPRADDKQIAEAARLLREYGPAAGIIVANRALRARGTSLASRIATATGAKLLAENLVPRMERGAGRVHPTTIPYPVDQAVAFFKDFKALILVGAPAPVAFFAYPGKPSITTPPGCAIHPLARQDEDAIDALERLADIVKAPAQPVDAAKFELPAPGAGAISSAALGASLCAFLPEGAVVADEAVTAGAAFAPSTRTARPHDWLKNMGGSIGFGLPAATGAALACPDRKVVCLGADGSSMYTLQALWTQAREKLDVTTVIFSNRAYAILRGELTNVGVANPGPRAMDMLSLNRPDLNWCELARGMGVEAERVTDMEGFNRHFQAALSHKGPRLIEVMM